MPSEIVGYNKVMAKKDKKKKRQKPLVVDNSFNVVMEKIVKAPPKKHR